MEVDYCSRATKRDLVAQCEEIARVTGQFILGPVIAGNWHRGFKKHGFRAKLGHAGVLRLGWMRPVGCSDVDEPRRAMKAMTGVHLSDVRTEGSRLIMVLRSVAWEEYLAREAPGIDAAMYAEYRGATKRTARYVGRAPFARALQVAELRRHMAAFEDTWRQLYFFVQLRMLPE